MKKLYLAVVLLFSIILLNLSVSAADISITPVPGISGQGESTLVATFDPTDISGYTSLRVDYMLQSTEQKGPGWHKQMFGLFDSDGNFIETQNLLPSDATLLGGISIGTLSWDISSATGIDFTKVCEFDVMLRGNRNATLTLTNLRVCKDNGNDLILSADCGQPNPPVAMFLYETQIQSVLGGCAQYPNNYGIDQTIALPITFDLSESSYISFPMAIETLESTGKLMEGPGYFHSFLRIIDTEGHTATVSDFMVHDVRGKVNCIVEMSKFNKDQPEMDMSKVVSIQMVLVGNRPATYSFDIDHFFASDPSFYLIAVEGKIASLEFVFDEIDFSNAFSFAYDYQIQPEKDGARVPGFHFRKAALFDVNGQMLEWENDVVLPEGVYGSGTVTFAIPPMVSVNKNRIAEFDVCVKSNITTIISIFNLRLLNAEGKTIETINIQKGKDPIAFSSNGIKLISSVGGYSGEEGRWSQFIGLDYLYSFQPIDVSSYKTLQFDLTTVQQTSPHDKLSQGPGYHTNGVILHNAKGQVLCYENLLPSDVRGRETLAVSLKNSNFDFTCLNGLEIYFASNAIATYYLDQVSVLTPAYKRITVEEVYALQNKPEESSTDQTQPVTPSTEQTPVTNSTPVTKTPGGTTASTSPENTSEKPSARVSKKGCKSSVQSVFPMILLMGVVAIGMTVRKREEK